MMFEYPFDIGSNRNRLHGIAKQIADHANIACMRQFDDHGKVSAMLLERCMRGMPDALPVEDATAGRDLYPIWIKRVTMMTDPLRPELPSVAMATALHQ
jgi:hypothetical protein